MIFLTFLCQLFSISAAQLIDKSIYLIEGEEYKVNLDSIFNEDKENTYSFQSDNKGFTLDTSSLKLKSDQGTYSIKPTKIIRERQLINLEDYQGLGQFGILDQHDLGHRICYNSDTIITLDQCLQLDNTATSYDFVFIDRNTIAVSKRRVDDQQFGVTIYKNKDIVSELIFLPSKTYAQVKQTIIEYAIFGEKKYLVFGVTEEDSNIELLEIQDDKQIVNTNKVIDKQLLPEKQTLQVFDIKGASNKVYVLCQSTQMAKLIINLTFSTKWSRQGYIVSKEFRALELGYSFINSSVTETYLECQQGSYNISSNQGDSIFRYLSIQIMTTDQVKYTLNYLIVLQGNLIFVSNLQRLAQRRNMIEGTPLKIDVDFQNDILIVFTDTKILTYYLKQATLQYQSDISTKGQVIVQAQQGESEQIAKINFDVIAKDDYNLYILQDMTKNLQYNLGFISKRYSIPLYGITGPAVNVDLEVDDSVQFKANYLNQYEIRHKEQTKKHVILEQLMTDSSSFVLLRYVLLRQFDDFGFLIYECFLEYHKNHFYCNLPYRSFGLQNQKVAFQNDQSQFSDCTKYALLNNDGLEINIYCGLGNYLNRILTVSPDQFVDMKLGTDMLFIYTKNYFIQFYSFPRKQVIYKFNISEYGQPQGEAIRKLWVNQAKTNLIVFTFGEDLIIGRYTKLFLFITRITIKWVDDVAIIANNKFIVLQNDKTTKKLTQYILEEGNVRIQRQLDTFGYLITGNSIVFDHVQGQIIIQALKGSQKALLIYGDTELARDSLLKVIKIEDDEFAVNVIYIKKQSCLFIRSKDGKRNSSVIMGINNAYKEFEINLTKIPNKFNQQFELQYTFSNEFSQIQMKKILYVEYQFQNITVKQPNQTISYNEDSLKIPIKPDTFQGQVRTLKLKVIKDPQISDHFNFNFTTRFKIEECLAGISYESQCKYVYKFERIICIGKQNLTYYDNNAQIVDIIPKISEKSVLKELILHNNESFALIRSNLHELILINISQNEIQLSQTYQWLSSLNVSVFYKEWLILCYQNQITYYRFQPSDDQFFLTEKFKQIVSNNIEAIQYDPLTKQIFYSAGNQNLYYFVVSLDGDNINKQAEYSFYLPQLLQSLKVYQAELIIQYFKVIAQQNNSYILVATSYGNIWNVTIGSLTQKFQINNMYIVNGPYQQVYDIQLIDDYMLVENYKSQLIFEDFISQYQTFQCLYKNTHDWSLNRPYLPLEVIQASKLVGLFKKEQVIIYIHQNRGRLCQNSIDDEVSIVINDLKQFPSGVLQVIAQNGYGQAVVNYEIIKEQENIWFVGIIIFVIVLGFFLVKLKKKSVNPLIDQDDQEKEVEL